VNDKSHSASECALTTIALKLTEHMIFEAEQRLARDLLDRAAVLHVSKSQCFGCCADCARGQASSSESRQEKGDGS